MRLPEPRIDDDVTGFELDRAVKNELRTLSKENAVGVGQHLVMTSRLMDSDIVAARAHAETAVRRAGRVASVREARGLVAYREGDFALALSEFRTARRLSGSHHLLPMMVDCERGLGRPEKALELAGSPEAKTLTAAEQVELRIVCSGIRRDMGQLDAAVVLLEVPSLNPSRRDPWSARLFYAYADALMARGDSDLARAWFAVAAEADEAQDTDAAERLDEIDGVVFVDLGEGDAESGAEEPEGAEVSEAAPVEVSTEPESVEVAQEPAPVEVAQEPERAEVSREPESVEVSRELEPVEVSRDLEPVEVSPEPEPARVVEDSVDGASEPEAVDPVQQPLADRVDTAGGDPEGPVEHSAEEGR